MAYNFIVIIMTSFQSLINNVGHFNIGKKTFLIPEMNKTGVHLLASVFKSYGINAQVIETCKGLDMGQEYTSGKECFPCQITTGDILYFMKKEKAIKGTDFHPENYVYFMPEAEGPCRFGMYNKFQRIILDSIPDLKQVKIESITSKDSYSLHGIIDQARVKDLRKTGYFSVVVADILDRLLWRVRPYEVEPGITDAFMERSTLAMKKAFEAHGYDNNYNKILEKLVEIVQEGSNLIDSRILPKPLIGIVGEIYLRSHLQANQNLVKVLESYGAEVVNASIAEWVNYASYNVLREAKNNLRLNLKQLKFKGLKDYLKKVIVFGCEFYYQEFKQRQAYKQVNKYLDLVEDHPVAKLDDILKREGIFSFDVGTEACLSIPGVMACAVSGYNGVVNVYPFTCMPSTITSAIIKSRIHKLKMPFLDTPYDTTSQPGREAAIRTFMFQASRHLKKHGRQAKSFH